MAGVGARDRSVGHRNRGSGRQDPRVKVSVNLSRTSSRSATRETGVCTDTCVSPCVCVYVYDYTTLGTSHLPLLSLSVPRGGRRGKRTTVARPRTRGTTSRSDTGGEKETQGVERQVDTQTRPDQRRSGETDTRWRGRGRKQRKGRGQTQTETQISGTGTRDLGEGPVTETKKPETEVEHREDDQVDEKRKPIARHDHPGPVVPQRWGRSGRTYEDLVSPSPDRE